MEINDQVVSIFKEYHIPLADGICYLMALHYSYKPSYIPEELKAKVQTTGIVTITPTTIEWAIPLFKDGVTAFGWVKDEMVPMFRAKNPNKAKFAKEATNRIKEYFAKNPEVRKEDILKAATAYLQYTSADYIRHPHYFVYKGKGLNRISDMENWLEAVKDEEDASATRNSISTTMQ